ncbi:MAG: hypothetical protein U0802_18720 [Candidatus Binatia bacterium]
MRSVLLTMCATALWAAAAATAGAACRGDCGGDGQVTVSDLVLGVNIALGGVAVGQCRAMDGDGDGTVTVAELIAAVQNALGGCPVVPTPTATPAEPTPVLSGQILFKSSRGGGSHIFVMDAYAANVVQLTQGDGFDVSAVWNADKSRIAFTRDQHLYVMNADGSGVTPLRQTNMQYAPKFSPDGTAIVFAESDSSNTNLLRFDLGSGQVTPLTAGAWNDADPAFTPDGASIFFTSNRDSLYGEIYRMNADGSNVVRITSNEDYEQLGAVSPDGSELAYAARDAHGNADLELVIAALDGSNARQITHDLGVEHPLWSPDGAYLLVRPFVAGRTKIYRLRRDGSGVTDLSNNDAYELAGDWR